MKLKEIARRLDCELVGDGEIEIRGVAGIEHARPGELTFLSNPRYRAHLKTTQASAVIVSKDFEPLPLPTLRSANPYLAFAHAVELFYHPPRPAPSIHPTAIVAPTAKLGASTSVGPYCVIEDEVEIGENAVLHSFVTIYRGARIGRDFCAHSHAVIREFCRIGDRVILQNGVVIGSDGYGFAKQADGSYYKIVQSGIVLIEDDVEVQANSCIDRASVGETRIGRGTKIDNLVQVGHSCVVGENTLLCAQVGLAGSTTVGKNVLLAGQVGVAGHLTIGDNVIATAQTGIPNDVPASETISGYPAIPNKQWLKCAAVYNRLPDLQKAVRELEAEVARLKAATG